MCTLRYVLNSFHRSSSIRGGDYRSPSLPAGWFERSRRLLGSVLEECANGQLEDVRAQLASLGYYLFQSVFPTVLQNELRNLARGERMLTLLILADQDAWLPWEVLHTGQAFLGEQFVIGRWMRELDEARPYEFPVGGVHVAHYANVPQPKMWVDLLTFPDIPEPLLSPSGVFADLEAAEAMRGLYLMRYGHPPGSDGFQDAPVMLDEARSNGSIDAEFRPAKLSLRRNRPLVSLGYVSAGRPELTMLEQAWVHVMV